MSCLFCFCLVFVPFFVVFAVFSVFLFVLFFVWCCFDFLLFSSVETLPLHRWEEFLINNLIRRFISFQNQF